MIFSYASRRGVEFDAKWRTIVEKYGSMRDALKAEHEATVKNLEAEYEAKRNNLNAEYDVAWNAITTELEAQWTALTAEYDAR